MTAPDGASRVELSAAACLFHGFSDPHRLQILQHLACLRECGLVTARPEGRAMVYALCHAEALEDLWATAERLLELTGHRVALCTNDAMRPGTDDAPVARSAGAGA